MTLWPEPISLRSLRTIAAALILLALVLLPVLAGALSQPFYVMVGTRILVFALAASGLNLILGYGGMVSFGHALYMGVGAYAVGILAFYGIASGWAHLGVTIAVCGLIALVTGLIALRTSGIGFIMITLAFAQMFYFLSVSLKQFGGDDGLQIAGRSDFWPLSVQSNSALYYFALGLLLLTLYLSWRFVHARFGRVLCGMKVNLGRMRVLGFPVLRYQVTAYVISGCICGIAGLLLANLTNFTSPAYMFWTVSGDLIVMIMLGGSGTVLGPVIGAVVFVVLETILSGYTDHSLLLIGIVIVLVARLSRRGLYGALSR